MRMSVSRRVFPILAAALVFVLAGGLSAQEGKKVLTFEDIMKFKEIRTARISEDGVWAAYAVEPGRGDGAAFVRHTKSNKVYSIPRGRSPQFSSDALWVAVSVAPGALEAAKAKKDKPKQGMALLNTDHTDIEGQVNTPELMTA